MLHLNIDALVLTATQCQLNVSLISQHELRILYAFFLVVERNQIKLSKLRGRRKVKAFAQQRAGNNGIPKLLQVVYWVLVPLLLVLRNQLYHLIIQLIQQAE